LGKKRYFHIFRLYTIQISHFHNYIKIRCKIQWCSKPLQINTLKRQVRATQQEKGGEGTEEQREEREGREGEYLSLQRKQVFFLSQFNIILALSLDQQERTPSVINFVVVHFLLECE
jgi:hypothetical protein